MKDDPGNDTIGQFLVGKGLEVGPEQSIKEARHLYIEPGNLYRLSEQAGIENADYVYSSEFINRSKYYRILLYEWFVSVKAGGFIVIEFKNNHILDRSLLLDEIHSLKLYEGKFQIIEDKKIGNANAIVIQKIGSIIRDENEINQWTFGIVTNGKRTDFIKKAIQSIRMLNIPEYEIILCGSYYDKLETDVVYIPFSEKDDKGWITKKKNIICENAKFENICVIHDRINFDHNWFQGMKRWGSYFDVLTCAVHYPEHNVTKLNWDTMGRRSNSRLLNKMSTIFASLDPTDWDRYAHIGGPIIIIKKSIWEKEKWDENLFWGDWEDVEYSHRQSDAGILLRHNPYITVNSEILTVAMMDFRREINSEKLGRLRGNHLLLIMLKLMDTLGFRRNNALVKKGAFFINKIYKTRSWKTDSALDECTKSGKAH